jgi:outer membrane autotransporter protein
MKPSLRLWLLLSAFSLQAFSLFCAAQTPPFPASTGATAIYYYDRYDAANDRYVYISATGTCYYVNSAGITTVGEPATNPITTPYRVTIAAGGTANFQFNNTHPALYMPVATGTGGSYPWPPDGLDTAANYAVRSGTWHASDVTFSILTTSDTAAIHISGYTGTGSTAQAHPAAFIGENVNAIVSHATGNDRRALAIYNGAEVFLHGGTLSKTVVGANNGSSETIYLVGNQEGRGSSSHLYGENLTIIASGSNIGAINMGNGNNTVTLVDSTITVFNNRNNTSQAILLADTQNLGGNHFTGTNLTITNNSGRVFAFGMGDNAIALFSSTVINNGAGAAFGWNATTSSSYRHFAAGSIVTLEDTIVTTTADYSPIFQMVGDWGGASVNGGTLSTTGAGSTILRLVAQHDDTDHTIFRATFQNTVIEALQGSVIDINIGVTDTNYGSNQIGGNDKNLTTIVDDAFNIIIRSSTVSGDVAALRMAAAGTHFSPYGERTNVFVYDSGFSGGIEMIAGGGLAETSGAYLTFTASNSQLSGGLSITGTEAARFSNRAIFYVYDSTWTGDLTLTNRGDLALHFNNTPIDGALHLSGSTWCGLNLTDSPLLGGINARGVATLTGFVTGAIGPITAGGNASIDLDLDRMPSGPITAGESADVRLRVGNALLATDATLTGGIHLSNSATLALTLCDTDRFNGDITIRDRATLAFATTAATPLTITGSVALAGIWRMPGKTILSGTLAITHPLGTLAIENASPDSLVLANGLSGNGRLDILSLTDEALKSPEFRVIHDSTGDFATDSLVLARPVDYGLAAYTLQNRPDGAWLVGGLSSAGAAIVNSQAMIAGDWFAALAPLNYRLGQFRLPGAGSSGASGNTGDFWFQARYDTTDVNRSGSSLDFTSRTLGFTAGIDTRWDYDNATLSIGIFADTVRTAREFTGSADGLTTGAGGGLYAHYQHRAGLHASIIARFDASENTFDTRNPLNAMNASYNTQAGGAALEAGWRFALPAGWWLEPAAQVALVSLPGVSYTTQSNRPGNVIDITTSDARAAQWLGRLAFGKTLDKNWHIRGHLAYATVNADGGAFTVPGLANIDFTVAGSRDEASLGIVRLLGRTGRLTLDASCTAASDYKRPCAIFLGYNHAW